MNTFVRLSIISKGDLEHVREDYTQNTRGASLLEETEEDGVFWPGSKTTSVNYQHLDEEENCDEHWWSSFLSYPTMVNGTKSNYPVPNTFLFIYSLFHGIRKLKKIWGRMDHGNVRVERRVLLESRITYFVVVSLNFMFS